MTDCKHDWHFIGESSRLRCERCKQVVGPWTTEHLTVPAGTGYAFANTTPSYTFVLHNADGKIGTLDFNGPEMVFTGDADKSAQVFFDHVGKYFDQRLKAERKAGRKEAEQITWGIDWGREGDRDCATIIKRLPDGTAEVIAVEYRL